MAAARSPSLTDLTVGITGRVSDGAVPEVIDSADDDLNLAAATCLPACLPSLSSFYQAELADRASER